jgi:hypothetical protein
LFQHGNPIDKIGRDIDGVIAIRFRVEAKMELSIGESEQDKTGVKNICARKWIS